MIASKAKNKDVIVYHMVLDMLDITARMYTPELNGEIEYLNEWCEHLKRKIETHDYTEDDERTTRVDRYFKNYDKSLINKICTN